MPRQPGTWAASRERTVSYHWLKAASSSGAIVALTTKSAGRVIDEPPGGTVAGRGDVAEPGTAGYNLAHHEPGRVTGRHAPAPRRSELARARAGPPRPQ